ncbi:putative Zn finger protein [Actinoplanes tereljensis]|uniref:SWIM-type domain-containing protein n=1 Tax=Paractinoplanes tereljensis TaxID=571912 RepID=A0A919NWG5_9ACTN|nr:hypothetical protein [Actinoplanes tereljensis]GIF25988.1 hypothetical protein Ate02nite_87180 [Actinoplanes tereljensis]
MTDSGMAIEFLGTFESLRMGPTFARGRRDERAGHVRQLTISGSLVVALVRGPEDATAFRARIAVRSFGASEWARVEQDLVTEARYAADLLGGRMPAGIGAVFAAAGLSLVPLSLDEVAMDCGCERWPMPCVHLAATCYALARSFEEDPFGVFAWRGRSRDELLLHLRELRAAAIPKSANSSADSEVYSANDSEIPSGDLGDPADFWGDQSAPIAPIGGRPGAVTRPDALLDQLDPPRITQQGRPIVDLLRPAYRAMPDA